MLDSFLNVFYESEVEVVGALAVVSLGLGLLWWLPHRRRSTPRRLMERALKMVSVEMLEDVLVPDGLGGHIHLDRLLLTAHGLLVIDTKDVPGAVFASDAMDDWTVIGQERRFTFSNPQGPLFDRVAAVRQLARDIPVEGHVLFTDRADFSRGRPKMVLQPTDLVQRYRKPGKADSGRLLDAFYPYWERVRRETVSARVGALMES